jgi:hypothetical protein
LVFLVLSFVSASTSMLFWVIITLIPDKKWFTLASGISGHVSEGSLLFGH